MVSIVSSVPEETVNETQHHKNTGGRLAQGLLGIYQPSLERIKNQLDELMEKQSSLVALFDGESNTLSNPESKQVLEEMNLKIELYMTKLQVIKKDMHLASEKMSQLKKRALWLQGAKQKDVLIKEYQRELQMQKEQELIAKPTTRKFSF